MYALSACRTIAHITSYSVVYVWLVVFPSNQLVGVLTARVASEGDVVIIENYKVVNFLPFVAIASRDKQSILNIQSSIYEVAIC